MRMNSRASHQQAARQSKTAPSVKDYRGHYVGLGIVRVTTLESRTLLYPAHLTELDLRDPARGDYMVCRSL